MPDKDNNDKKTFQDLSEASKKELYKMSSIFPPFFRTHLIIEPDKVTIIDHVFFWEKEVIVMLIKDIKNVNVYMGPLFASMKFDTEFTDPDRITGLPKGKAHTATELITGLRAAAEEDINLSNKPVKEIRRLALETGKAVE